MLLVLTLVNRDQSEPTKEFSIAKSRDKRTEETRRMLLLKQHGKTTGEEDRLSMSGLGVILERGFTLWR